MKRLGILAIILVVLAVWGWFVMIRMPGKSYRGPLPALTSAQASLSESLRADVDVLAGRIGQRNVFTPERLAEAAAWIEQSLASAGYRPERHEYAVTLAGGGDPVSCANLVAELDGGARASEIVLIGGHYDSVLGSPGANDNASGVAATLALARRFAGARPARTFRFAFFVNEEPPFFQTDQMGSLVYARQCRARDESIVAMISLETIGYYTDQPDSQGYPPPLGLLYPSTGNFIGFVSNVKSRKLLREIVGSFREHAEFPSEGGAIFGGIPGVGWSDHWAFWRAGYPGLMVTDTAPFRYPYYHTPHDTPDRIDYERMARVVEGLAPVLEQLANPE